MLLTEFDVHTSWREVLVVERWRVGRFENKQDPAGEAPSDVGIISRGLFHRKELAMANVKTCKLREDLIKRLPPWRGLREPAGSTQGGSHLL